MSRATALESDFGSSWPGIGNIGIVVVDALKGILGAEELGEIGPWEFFCTKMIWIRNGILESLEFLSSEL